MSFLLAQNVSSEFLLDPIKPVILFATAMAGCAFISAFVSDVRKCGLPSFQWHGILIGGITLAFFAGILIPTFWISWPMQLILTAATIGMYWKARNAAVPEKLKFIIGGDKVRAFFKKRGKVKAQAGATLSFKDSNKKDRPNPPKNDPKLPAFLAADTLLSNAILRRASRIDLVAKPDGVSAGMTVDGVRSKVDATTPEITMAMIDFMKDLCGLDLKEMRKRQTGTFFVINDEVVIPLTFSIAGSSAGQQLRIEIDRAKNISRTIAQVGFLPAQEKTINSLMEMDNRGGVVLVCAAPGQGLTSTCLALLSGHDAFTAAVKTLEKNLVHRLDGIDHQVWASVPGGVDYPKQLQSIIRRSPDVVYVEDISDIGSGTLIASPNNSEIRFYIAVPADGVSACVSEWFKSVGNVILAAQPLRMVIAQKLCRKLCIACRVGYQPSPEQAKKLNIAAGKQVELFKASGKVQTKNKIIDCPMCNGTGYVGQTIISEVFVIDAEARAFLAPKGDFKSAYNASRMKYKLPGLQEAALLRVRDGTTSLEEVIRVLSPATKPTAPTTTAPGAATAAKPTTAKTASTPNAKISSIKPLVPGSKPTTPLTKPPTKPKT